MQNEAPVSVVALIFYNTSFYIYTNKTILSFVPIFLNQKFSESVLSYFKAR